MSNQGAADTIMCWFPNGADMSGRGTSEIEAMLIFDTHIVLGATLQVPWRPRSGYSVGMYGHTSKHYD